MIYRNGTIWTNYRLKVTGPCNMDLTTFPLDTQKCKLTFESYNYNNQEVLMKWNPNTEQPIKMFGSEMLPDFQLISRLPIYKNEVIKYLLQLSRKMLKTHSNFSVVRRWILGRTTCCTVF